MPLYTNTITSFEVRRSLYIDNLPDSKCNPRKNYFVTIFTWWYCIRMEWIFIQSYRCFHSYGSYIHVYSPVMIYCWIEDWLAVHYSCDLKKCTSMRRNIHSTSEQRLVLWSKTSTQDLIRVNKTWCDKLDKYARDCVIKVVINWANTGLLSVWPP